MRNLARLLLLLLPFRAWSADPPYPIASAWNSAQARQDLGFILYSYYEYSAENGGTAEDQGDSSAFSQHLESFLGSQGREGDCALVHSLWFDLGEGAEGDIVEEIAARGEHMLPIIAFAIQQLALASDQGGDDCGVVVRLDQATVRDIYLDCVKEIRGDGTKQAI